MSNPDFVEKLSERVFAWNRAKEMVDPVIEQHGLEKHTSGGHSLAIGMTYTKVDQHLMHIVDLANWLLRTGEGDG